MKNQPTIGIIGAGIAGLACASSLRAAGLSAVVLEKSRGLGGRLATRRLENGCTFDHGAQFFTVRNSVFETQVEAWLNAGVVQLWNARIVAIDHSQPFELSEPTERYVGVPTMNAIAKSLAEGIEVRTNVTAQEVRRTDHCWEVVDTDGNRHGPFTFLLTTAPPLQSAKLLGDLSPVLHAELAKVTMAPCWAVMLQLRERLPVAYDGAFVNQSSLSWIARNSSKPARHDEEHWVLHATAQWSANHVESDAADVADRLVQEFWRRTRQEPLPIEHQLAHRWRYALPLHPLTQHCLFDEPVHLGAAGDWCGGPRVEGAYLSGIALAQAVLEAAGMASV